jgi:hypothetical protein
MEMQVARRPRALGLLAVLAISVRSTGQAIEIASIMPMRDRRMRRWMEQTRLRVSAPVLGLWTTLYKHHKQRVARVLQKTNF